MRILQIHNRHREFGGEDAVARAEAELLESNGHEVVKYRTTNPSGNTRALSTLALAVWNPLSARELRKVIIEQRPDVAHVHNTWFALSPSILCTLHKLRIPVVLTLHNYRIMCANAMLLRDNQPCELCVRNHPWNAIRHRCYQDSFFLSALAAGTIAANNSLSVWQRYVDLFLTMTFFGKSRFVAAGLPEDRIRVKPHFVPDPGARSVPPSRSRTVLFVGRLSREKGIHVLLEAWSAFRPTSLELLILGDGPLRRELEMRAEGNVFFRGWVGPGEIQRCMLNARALVFPSIWYETFGLSIVEAMAAGLPVLASDLGGTPELLGPANCTCLFTPGDPAALVVKLRSLEDDYHVDESGHYARQSYVERYSPENGLILLEDAYRLASSGR